MNELKLLGSLSEYYIEYGVFTSEGIKTVKINVEGEDQNTSIEMKIGDIMFFTEYGTLTIPGTFVLEKSASYIDNLLNDEISDLVDEILNGEVTNESEIESYFRILCLKLENMIQGFMKSLIQNNSRLSEIVKGDKVDDNKYIYNLEELSKYIKCRYFKRK